MTGKHTDTTARIVSILVDCGMIAREELEIVRGLIRGAVAAKDHLLTQSPLAPGQGSEDAAETQRGEQHEGYPSSDQQSVVDLRGDAHLA